MIIDLPKFIARERPYWNELESLLGRFENDPELRLDLPQAKHFHYLYQRASADLGKIATFAAEPEIRSYLETLVARAYGEIHEIRDKPHRLKLGAWFFGTFPQTFRQYAPAFWLTVGITIFGCGFGALALAFDPSAKAVVLPFEHLLGDPSERVAREESSDHGQFDSGKASFSTSLMTHNTRVAIFTFALGITWGVGTAAVLFYNGVILGAVSLDYLRAGQGKFLAGWLLPHGTIEIPAILIAGQAGFILASALIGWGDGRSRRERLRAVSPDVMTLIFGVACLLIWAGFVEAFLSQYHEPIVPYEAKIGIGLLELVLLVLFLGWSGTKSTSAAHSLGRS